MVDSSVILKDEIHIISILSKEFRFEIGTMILSDTERTLHIGIFDNRDFRIWISFDNRAIFEYRLDR